MSSAAKSWSLFLTWALCLGVIAFYPYRFGQIEQGQAHQDQQQASVFLNFSYYMTKHDKKQLQLAGRQMRLHQNQHGEVIFPEGKAFTEEEQDEVPFKANEGYFWSQQQRVELRSQAFIAFDGLKVEGSSIEYKTTADLATAHGDVRSEAYDPKSREQVVIFSDRMKAYPKKEVAHYYGAVNGFIERPQRYESRTNFESHELHFYWPERKLNLFGSVYLKKGDLQLWGDRGNLFLDHYNKKLKYYVLFDDVRLKERIVSETGKESVRRAFGEKLEGIAATGEMILTGTPKVIQDGDELRGYRIILQEQSGVVEVDDSNTTFKRIQ